jgi:hypothetical protein
MEATQFDLAAEYVNAAPVCTTNGTSKTCTFNAGTGGVSSLIQILFSASWNGLYTSTISLA